MKFIYFLLSFIAVQILLTSCTTTSTERFIQNAEFSGTSKEHTVRITNNSLGNQITLRPRVIVAAETDYEMNTGNHPKVNNEGIFELNYEADKGIYREKDGVNIFPFEGKNFSWESPKVIYSMELEYAATKNIALYAGVDMADFRGKQYWGNWFGLGLMTENEDFGIRGDLNYDFRNNHQSIDYYVKEKHLLHYDWFTPVYDEYYIHYIDEGKNESKQFTFALTLNTKSFSLLNGFCSLAFDKITLIDYVNMDNGGLFGRDEEYELSQNRTHFILGLYQDIGDFRILLGTNFTRTNTGDMDFLGRSEWTNSFFMQFDIIL